MQRCRSVYREGASGAKQIQDFLAKLGESPLESVGGVKVAKSINFATDAIFDADGIRIPPEKFYFYTLENGYSFAVRGSGTEPKIKFYAFAHEKAENPVYCGNSLTPPSFKKGGRKLFIQQLCQTAYTGNKNGEENSSPLSVSKKQALIEKLHT